LASLEGLTGLNLALLYVLDVCRPASLDQGPAYYDSESKFLVGPRSNDNFFMHLGL